MKKSAYSRYCSRPYSREEASSKALGIVSRSVSSRRRRRSLAVHSHPAAWSASAARAAAGPAKDRLRLLAELNAEPQVVLIKTNLRNRRTPPQTAYHRVALDQKLIVVNLFIDSVSYP